MSKSNLGGLVLAVLGVAVAGTALVKLVGSAQTEKDALNMTPEAVTARLKPAGNVVVSDSGPPGSRSGEAVYKAICFSCHDTGAAGAPKLGDSGAWAPRIAQGYELLTKHAVEGIRAMPAKGGSPDLTNEEVARTVAFIANKAGASFKAPEAGGAAAGGDKKAEGGKVDPAKGQEIYKTVCSACHDTGAAGAPKLGDKAAWAPRVGKGMDALVASATKGLNAMPPKGGYSGSDEEFRAAVEYVVSKAK